jgi:hypothetical protein
VRQAGLTTQPQPLLFAPVPRRPAPPRPHPETGEGYFDAHEDSSIWADIFVDQGGACAICNMAAWWNGATLKFILDHIDGAAGISY